MFPPPDLPLRSQVYAWRGTTGERHRELFSDPTSWPAADRRYTHSGSDFQLASTMKAALLCDTAYREMIDSLEEAQKQSLQHGNSLKVKGSGPGWLQSCSLRFWC